MPTARHPAAFAVVDGKLYVVGGRIGEEFNNVDLAEVYDPVLDSWTTNLEPRPSKRSGIGAVSLNGAIYVLGGELTPTTFDNNERYDPDRHKVILFFADSDTSSDNKLFICSECRARCKSEDLLNEHMYEEHGKQ